MKVSEDCFNCLSKLVTQAAEMATTDIELQKIARDRALSILKRKFKPGVISIVLAAELHDAIKKATGNSDPYRKMKDLEIEMARQLSGSIKINYSENFENYLRLAALGNAIDFFRSIDEVKDEITKGMDSFNFAIDDSAHFKGKVQNSEWILYLADNAGEVFFDLLLLKLMRRYARVTYVVKSAPVQNDITLDDIKKAGLESEIGEIMTTGTATPGIDFSRASGEFNEAFRNADFIFAKGMGYYEALEELTPEGKIFYCLKAKCRPVADSLEVPLYSYVAMLR